MGYYVFYAPALKVLAVRWRLQGVPYARIKDRLGKDVSDRTIRRWVSVFRATRAVMRDPATYARRGRPRALHARETAFIEACIDLHPDLFLDEIREQLYDEHGKMPSLSTIQTELRHRLQITLKKPTLSTVRKDYLAKLRWMDRMMHYPSDYLVFTDESSICARDLLRVRQRARRGRRTTRYAPRLRNGRYCIIPGISRDGLIAMGVYQGTIKRRRFEQFLKYKLLPRMGRYPGPRSVLVLDNASIHKGGRIERLCDQKGVRLRYLPKYCPELNPVELAFGVIKGFLRRTQALVRGLDPVQEIKDAAAAAFEGGLMAKLYRRCGYRTGLDDEP